MLKKIIFLIFSLSLLANDLFAGEYIYIGEDEIPRKIIYGGLVPCGKCMQVASTVLPTYVDRQECGISPSQTESNVKYLSCQPCHIFIIIVGVIEFFFKQLLPPLLALLLVIVGVLFLWSFGEEELIQKGKMIIHSMVFATLFLFSTWILVNIFFKIIGVAEWTGLKEGWFKIRCQIREEKLTYLPPSFRPPPGIANKPSGCPVPGAQLTSGFGRRMHPILRIIRFHKGVDLGAPYGRDVFSTGTGTVVFAGWMSGYGNTVDIDHGGGFKTRYAHLSKINVSVGEHVGPNTVIGKVGSTGLSTGPHLHYEVYVAGNAVNPINYDLCGENQCQCD